MRLHNTCQEIVKFVPVCSIVENSYSLDETNIEYIILDNGEQKINFLSKGQGYQAEIKKLRVMNSQLSSKAVLDDKETYINQCFAAIKENPNALKYVKHDIPQFDYYKICKNTMSKAGNAIDSVNLEKLGRNYYFDICKEAAKCAKFLHAAA